MLRPFAVLAGASAITMLWVLFLYISPTLFENDERRFERYIACQQDEACSRASSEWRMAEASELQSKLLVGEVGLLFLTALFAAAAVYEARKAAKHTDQMLLAQRLEQRAWMAFERLSVDFDRDSDHTPTAVLVFAVWKNVGKTPAMNVQLAIFKDLLQNRTDAVHPIEIPVKKGYDQVGAGMSKMTVKVPFAIDQLRAIAEQSVYGLVHSVIVYSDIFSSERHVEVVSAEVQITAPIEELAMTLRQRRGLEFQGIQPASIQSRGE